MNLSKINITKYIAKKSLISEREGSKILEFFLHLVKSRAKSRPVKISGFGSFSLKKTPKRIGRNPKTKESYIIHSVQKIKFTPSCKLKKQIN